MIAKFSVKLTLQLIVKIKHNNVRLATCRKRMQLYLADNCRTTDRGTGRTNPHGIG